MTTPEKKLEEAKKALAEAQALVAKAKAELAEKAKLKITTVQDDELIKIKVNGTHTLSLWLDEGYIYVYGPASSGVRLTDTSGREIAGRINLELCDG